MEFKRGVAIAGLESEDYEKFKLKEYQDALKIVRDYITNDPEIKLGYVANIAMSFKDYEHHYRKSSGKRYLNRDDKHTIANNAAVNFMDLWLK